MPPAKRKVAPTKEEPSEENGVKRLKQDPPDIRERFCLDICNPVVRRHRQFRYSEGEPFVMGVLPLQSHCRLISYIASSMASSVTW